MDINDAFPSQYLKASDLKGKSPVVTIDRIAFEPVGQRKEMKPILYFKNKDKGIVLNKTNAKIIANLTGETETENWIGFSVRIYSARVEFQGESVDGIRVKAVGKVEPTKPAPVSDDADDVIDATDIPF